MSRTVTLLGFALIGAAMVGFQLHALVTGRTPTFGEALAALLQRTSGRAIVAAFWLWLGWHVFVRSSWG